MIDLTMLVQAVIMLIAAIITTFVVPWIKARVTAEQYRNMIDVVSMLVTAAEQIYTGSGRGEEKLKYVTEQLMARGYSVDLAAIEAQVKALFNTEAKANG